MSEEQHPRKLGDIPPDRQTEDNPSGVDPDEGNEPNRSARARRGELMARKSGSKAAEAPKRRRKPTPERRRWLVGPSGASGMSVVTLTRNPSVRTITAPSAIAAPALGPQTRSTFEESLELLEVLLPRVISGSGTP